MLVGAVVDVGGITSNIKGCTAAAAAADEDGPSVKVEKRSLDKCLKAVNEIVAEEGKKENVGRVSH